MHRIYLDNNSTTCLDPRVIETIKQALDNGYGNPSSTHAFGQEARNRITKARRFIAEFLGIRHADLYFNSGGTEGVNTLLRGVFDPGYNGHLITTNVEHSCVFTTAKILQERGVEVTFLSPGKSGAVTAEQVKEAIQENTKLIAIMAVNNETGAKTDFESIAAVAEHAGVPLFLDAVSLMGKERFTIPEGVTALAFSGHKFHAPKGIGGLFIRNSLKIAPLLTGGHQEHKKRAGTENVLGILALEEAVRCLEDDLQIATPRMLELRDHLDKGLQQRLSDIIINADGPRVVNTTNISFLGVDGESLLMNLDLAGIAISHGSACSSGSLEPSRILINMGADKSRATTSIRFSLSRFTTQEEIERTIDIVTDVVIRLRSIH